VMTNVLDLDVHHCRNLLYDFGFLHVHHVHDGLRD
jgi:hypothetical protein